MNPTDPNSQIPNQNPQPIQPAQPQQIPQMPVQQPIQSNAAIQQSFADKAEKSADTSALLALISGSVVFLYHLIILIVQPSHITIWWYIIIFPIVAGVTGIKSKKRRPMAIAGLALAAVAIIIFVILATSIYDFSK